MLRSPPKSTTATAAAAITCSRFIPRSNFSACPQSYSLQFHAFRIGYSTKFINKPFVHTSSSPNQMAASTSDQIRVSPSPTATVITLNPIEATPESFQEFGQVVEASPDGDEFGPHDAQLDLSRGIPRFSLSLSLSCLLDR